MFSHLFYAKACHHFCGLPQLQNFTFSSKATVCRVISTMASTIRKPLESPFCHVEMYGVEHPTIEKLRHTNRKAKSKSQTSSRKSSTALTLKKAEGLSSTSGHSSVTRGHKKKRKKKNKAPRSELTISYDGKKSVSTAHARSAQASHTLTQLHSSHTPTQTHSGKTPNEIGTNPTSGLARVDQGSPCQVPRKHYSQSSSWKRLLSSETTTSGYISDKSQSQCSNSRTVVFSSNFSVISQTISTSDVLQSLSESQDNLKSKIINSPINVSLKKTSQTRKCLPPAASHTVFNHTFSSVPGLKSRRSVKSSTGFRSSGEGLSTEDIVWRLGRLQFKKIIVMSGAGISTSSGIPDFRSPGTGLYDNLQQYRIPDPTAIFDIGFFSRNPKPFFTLAKELYPGKYQPNTVHHFVRLLQEKRILLRNYTQNIDGLERIAGISPSKLVEAHGSFSSASCIKCKSKQEQVDVKAAIFNGRVPRCKHKYCMGLVKPDIVFFGEDLPARFYSLQLRDFSKCDLLIIMGTSLEVEPFASLCTLPRFDVPRLLINRELVGPFKRGRKRMTDVALTGDLVDTVSSVIEGAGWSEDLRCLIGEPPDEEIETARASTPIDVQNIAGDDTLSNISTESDPAVSLSPLLSDPTLPDQEDTDSVLASHVAALKLTQKDSQDSPTGRKRNEDIRKFRWTFSSTTDHK